MQYKTPGAYILQTDAERRPALERLRDTINQNIPQGFQETIQYNMISWVIPLSRYPQGYHCTPHTPLPFLSIAVQKHYLAMYHSGLFMDPGLYDWFVGEYQKLGYKHKINMGKSCVRFKYLDEIPYDLIGELMSRISVDQFIARYEAGRSIR
ncbi:DUF1801 domain-containing protein [Spirochaeta lutea]|uniref:YdhG-like domain-containing protein n=1 Tax=Spirochaeta lutea TaxID=1480694 RepID=A0A098QTA4_9SPIO|nr:DUF1801 domain-containing protein [Spirochaeta lutea]KGE70934.1 hypothetical protein DC28_13405 [Spirochaeta lutea]